MTIWTPHLPEDRPKYLGLADAIEADIASGNLAPGQRLPTHRDLADTLGVTVGTVTRGYAEAARRGAVRGEVGRGTIVRPVPEGGGPWWGGGPGAQANIDLGLVTDMYGLDPDLGAALRDLAGRSDVQEFLRYQPSRGMARHREAGAKWCGLYGVKTSPEQVLVTAGGQHGLFVLFSVLFRHGDRVAVGQLNYPGLISASSLLGIKLVPVAMDGEGIIPEALEEACAREGVRGLYCMPGAHNPTTASPSPERQERLAKLARARNLLVVEDAAYALTTGEPCVPLAEFAAERAFLVCSVSKMVDGGLRVGFVASPHEYVERLGLGITSTMWMASPLCAEITASWIFDGTAESVLRRKLAEAARRNEVAHRVLAGCAFAALPHGYFIWLMLPEPWRAADFERAAALRGVVVIAGDAFAVGQTPAPAAVRVSLSAARNREELERGLTVLAELLREAPRPGRAIV
ncbi:MAG: PLP-dependent aminotransferase family protein [Humidesulfovibrio sp.]|nr:PLP-dependent aminotransferase family protein [Humidesulfovibrio sp.]